ncbi:unnamed protein product [Heterobilharzia americana]|nr:unnamed protein product [Heterobilharzia americana]
MFGLPGLLCTIDQRGKAGDIIVEDGNAQTFDASLNIYGPKGLRRFIRLALALSRANLSYTYAVHELIFEEKHCPSNWHEWACLEADVTRDPPLSCERPGRDICVNDDGFWYNIMDGEENKGVLVHAMSIKHTIPSLGWLIIKPSQLPSLCADTAMKLGVPKGRLMGELKRGKTVVVDGKTIHPDEVLKSPLRGHRVAIMGDTYDSSELLRLMQVLQAKNQIASIILDTLCMKLLLTITCVVAKLASQLNVRQLVLTHFSHRYDRIDVLNENILQDGHSEHISCTKKAKNDKKSKPSLQIILDQAKSTGFNGDIILADDQMLVKIPQISYHDNISM